MIASNKNNHCRTTRQRLADAVGNHLHITSPWIQSHLASCPHCRRRLSGFSKAALALSLLKSEPHQVTLLSRANAQAIGVLRRSLRDVPHAEKLRHVKPEPSFIQRCRRYSQSFLHAAACIGIMILIRTGVFASMEKFHSKGTDTMRQYYAHHLGDELSDEIFTA